MCSPLGEDMTVILGVSFNLSQASIVVKNIRDGENVRVHQFQCSGGNVRLFTFYIPDNE